MTPVKGDVFSTYDMTIYVKRVGETWADIQVSQIQSHGGAIWSKRQPLPFPADWKRIRQAVASRESAPRGEDS